MAGVTQQPGTHHEVIVHPDGAPTTSTAGGMTTVMSAGVAVRPSIRVRGGSAALTHASGGPSAALMTWLNAVGPQYVRTGARTLVTCCGAGDDAALLVDRGYEVVAFDISHAAIEMARARHTRAARVFHHADLHEARGAWRGRFDFVVDVNAVCHASDRIAHLRALSGYLTARGTLLVICHATGEPGRAPGPLTCAELGRAVEAAGLEAVEEIADFEDDDEANGGHRLLRAVLRRSGAASGMR